MLQSAARKLASPPPGLKGPSLLVIVHAAASAVVKGTEPALSTADLMTSAAVSSTAAKALRSGPEVEREHGDEPQGAGGDRAEGMAGDAGGSPAEALA